ncbi:tail tubular protein [Alteromonas phage ZP6]|uniref:Major tail subunit n=1 Tax=Alteromonas phage ZP6 TaxID=2492447 RepID=A0A3S9U8G6_9CAUD|nr:tail protein [Alteromonas phage ZP6]AZS06560.1 tail tubular protein [Alteromonas phage ZP6]
MTTAINICNQAISEVGGEFITDLNDAQREATLCKTLYPAALDHVLTAARWSFLGHRVILSPSANVPAFGFRNAFEIGGDILEIYEVFDQVKYNPDLVQNNLYWQREGDYILADADVIYVKCKIKKTDPSEFSPQFTQAVSAYLAHLLAMPMANNRALSEAKYMLFKDIVSESANLDSMQGKTRKLRASRLTDVRRF